MAFQTADTLLQQATSELGLAVTTVASTDALSVQLVALLNKACQRLTKTDWSQLTVRYSFSPGTTSPYTLPADYRTMVEQTAWDTTMQQPLVGPLTEQQWELFVARLGLGNAVGVPFRTWQNALYLYPTTGFPSGRTIAFEYRSSYWAITGVGTTPNTDKVTVGTDVVWLDQNLVVAALKLEWKREKGFDSTAAQQDYEVLFQQAQDDNADAPILSLNRGGGNLLLGWRNLPDTGYGGS